MSEFLDGLAKGILFGFFIIVLVAAASALVWLAFIDLVAFLCVLAVIAVTWATFRVAGLPA